MARGRFIEKDPKCDEKEWGEDAEETAFKNQGNDLWKMSDWKDIVT